MGAKVTTFLRLLNDEDKQVGLRSAVQDRGENVFDVDPISFKQISGAPFAYWISDDVRKTFLSMPALSSVAFLGKGPDTGDDFRFLRLFWETTIAGAKWISHPKGGPFSRYYADVNLKINWDRGGKVVALVGNMRNPTFMFRPGLTWSRRTSSELSLRAMPAGCVFADKGPAVFDATDSPVELMALLAILNSLPFRSLVKIHLAAADAAARSYEVGILQKTPILQLSVAQRHQLSLLSRRAWSLKRAFSTSVETSHAFVLPRSLMKLGDDHWRAIENELASIQREIDNVAFELYRFSQSDRLATIEEETSSKADQVAEGADDESEEADTTVDTSTDLLSWAVGVAFGRFDWRLATGEREEPREPGPFDPLPDRSPGMLPVDSAPFHSNSGVLVDDPGHSHDLTHLVEEVLERVAVPVPNDVRRWLQRDFFSFHLQRYSKSRRKAPIYWPLSTASGSYTLWLYYPTLSSQTLYIAVNDFVDGPSGKLKQVDERATALRNKGAARTSSEEAEFEELQVFELELIELRNTLLGIAQHYHPSMDDGVQISAAPLWSFFRHRAWQKVLKDTWAKLEKGDYDWAHLSMNYWSARVREKCRTDKSLAIAQDLEELYVEPAVKPKPARARKKQGVRSDQ